jgi:anti-sigma B factor antagonist
MYFIHFGGEAAKMNEIHGYCRSSIERIRMLSLERDCKAMNIEQRRLNRVDLLTLQGRIDAATAPALKHAIEQLFEEGRYRIVLDLAQLEYISSPGLRVLIEARKKARDWKLTDIEGGDIRIANLPPRIKEVFDLTGFTSLFEIYDDAVAAVGSF